MNNFFQHIYPTKHGQCASITILSFKISIINKILASMFIFHCKSKQGIAQRVYHHHHHHLSLNREGRWGATDDFAISFLQVHIKITMKECKICILII